MVWLDLKIMWGGCQDRVPNVRRSFELLGRGGGRSKVV
jgi:hypothetical protein